jgi:DNA polymerase-3 subunit delta
LPENTVKPVVYILHGDDSVEIEKFVDAMIARMGDPTLIELNLSRLDARSTPESDLRTAALAMPFLAERRLVVLYQAQTRLGKSSTSHCASQSPRSSEGPDFGDPGEGSASHPGEGSEERFKLFLNHLPVTTALVLVVSDEFVTSGAHRGWQALPQKHWLWQWLETVGTKALYRACRRPLQEDMPGWIKKKAEALGGKFDLAAARALSDHTGNDTQYALHEIIKLLTYVDFKRPVEPGDIELLTAPGGQVNVFDMVDALAEGNSNRAMRLLQGLLDETDTVILFGMIVRQFRLLIQAREVLDEGGSAETMMREFGVVRFVAQKLAGQAAGFSMSRLHQVYHRLLELDEGSKSSQWTPELAMELFVAEMKA